MRLCQIGHEVGLLPKHRFKRFEEKRQRIHDEMLRLNSTRVNSESLAQLLRRPEASYKDLPSQDASLDGEVIRQIETEIRYAGYVDRQQAEVEKLRSLEDKRIPEWLNYEQIPGLRIESRLKLLRVRPTTLGQATRISGVSPADIGLLMVWIKRGNARSNEKSQT
jgi:tRNA uridine 5-carboxymethylaminomethyl modification enzyme